MSSIDIEELDKLVVDVRDLKNYRNDGSIYFKKCAEFIERIRNICNDVRLEDLNSTELQYLKSIQQLLAAEERFSKSSFESRSVDAWKKFLND